MHQVDRCMGVQSFAELRHVSEVQSDPLIIDAGLALEPRAYACCARAR